MREPVTLLEQVNVFKKSNHRRLVLDRTPQQHRPVYSFLNNADNDNEELKTLSVDVYATKHLVAAGKAILPYSERIRLDDLLLSSINKDISHDENRHQRKKKRRTYRTSLFHTYSSNSTEFDLAQLTACGTKPESQLTIPVIRDDDTDVSSQRHHAPPPSPSDEAMGQLLYKRQGTNQSRPPSRQSPIEKEGYIPFRLPVLNRPARFRHSSRNSSSKDIRSILSNYLQKYY